MSHEVRQDQMQDPTDERDPYTEWPFENSKQGFFDKSSSVRLFLGFLFALILFPTLHFKETKVEVLELNRIAQKYVVAQTDFDFPDDQKSAVLRRESANDIGKIYKIQEKELRHQQEMFEAALVEDQSWRQEAPTVTFEEMYRAFTCVQGALQQARFSDIRTVDRVDQLKLSSQPLLLFVPSSLEEPVSIPKECWAAMIPQCPNADYKGEATGFAIRWLKDKLWPFEEDAAEQHKLRKALENWIPDQYTHIQAGDRIIDKGEKITPRHLAMLQAMKASLGDSKRLWSWPVVAGSLIETLVILLVGALFFRSIYPEVYYSNKKLCLIFLVMMLTLAFAKITEFMLLKSTSSLLEMVRFPIIVPFAAIILCSLMNMRVAVFISIILVALLTISLAVNTAGFLLINLMGSLVAVLYARRLRKRKDVFAVSIKVWLACVLLILGWNLYGHTYKEAIILGDLVTSLIFMLFTAVLVVGFLPVFEAMFEIMTDITLMEFMDPGNPLLRRLSLEAPGTYQHSIVVGNLAEAAASAIGANGLFCRVSTQYHDIGKLANPHYFTENQQGGMNMHHLLTPKESAQVIISHVTEGVALARKANLPESFIDVIKEHHGTTLVYYFYRKALEQAKAQGATVTMEETPFRYAGPRPRTKESAVIMVADTFEAASRCLDEVSEKTLSELIDALVRLKAEDGQFDKCPLTFQELTTVKRTMVQVMLAAGHSRIKYPKLLQSSKGSATEE